MPLLSVRDLRTYFHTRNGIYRAVDGVSFDLERGETLGIVGESGSGKSVTCYSIMGLVPQPPGRIESGSAVFDGVDLLKCSAAEARRIRGKRIAMIFQDPMTSLNPFMRIGDQIIEPLLIHEKMPKAEARQRALQMLEAVGIKDAASRIESFPHEFSGGMRQRVMIAMALITKPDILIADEPTTALDVTVQAQILDLIRKMQRELGMAVIFITHDLAVVSGLCDRTQVMYAGRIVETAPTKELFTNPQHPYTKALQRCIPALQPKGVELYAIPGMPPDLSKPISEEELLARFKLPPETVPVKLDDSNRKLGGVTIAINDIKTHFPIRSGFLIKKETGVVKAVDGVNLQIREGEVLGLVGESGSGKSTLSRTIMQLVPTTAGTIVLEGRNLTSSSAGDIHATRRHMQMVFQDPYASLNPRMTVFATLAEPLLVHKICPQDQITARVTELMKTVGLAPRFMQKYPHEFSGGQRQRIAIARALALEPRVIIADEPVSALDVSIQAQILNLLASLVRRMNLTMIFIAHDLSVVKHISDRIAVMYQGKIVELGSAVDIMENPQHPYTQKLIKAIPRVDA
ncbi:MAG: ABC transporter ATP-binding protein [Opitutaceae bacterium]|nr:ABC transporter ATP-binding protein [Opitutaceae bacterium]